MRALVTEPLRVQEITLEVINCLLRREPSFGDIVAFDECYGIETNSCLRISGCPNEIAKNYLPSIVLQGNDPPFTNISDHIESISSGVETPSARIVKASRFTAAHKRLKMNPVDSFLATYGSVATCRDCSTKYSMIAGSVKPSVISSTTILPGGM